MKPTHYFRLAFFLLLALHASLFTYAQKKKSSDATKEEKKEEDAIKSLDEVVKKAKKYPGLFTVYQDTVTGKVYMEITKAQLGKEFIHFSQVVDAPPTDAFVFRGAYGYGKIFKINKHFEKIEITLQNTAFYFDPANALSKSAEANINQPIIFSDKIAGISKDKSAFLIDADKLFVGEIFDQYKPSSNPEEKPGENFKLGSFSKEKSKFVAIKNYPLNSDFITELAFEDGYPINSGNRSILTDPRNISFKVRNTLIAMPENDFKARYDDARVGYFSEQVTDLSSTKAAPYRDPISRWFLKKKDPAAALSEPVEPIVWWIENTTPKEIRPFVRDGVLEWNKAFESAGFKNAVVVKEQPDNADWDAGDIRYNVLRWTSSPEPYFGGYGPSFVNPRTGQILGADVMLEYIFISGRLREQQIFETAAMDYLKYSASSNYKTCSFSSHLQRSVMLGKQMISVLDRGLAEEKKLLQQSVYMLCLHEVGHTLGLNHNMKASNLHDAEKIHDEKLGREIGLTGSVMDYSNVNVSPDPAKQGLYYDVIPGPYDHWAIQFGYTQYSSPAEEAKSIKELLAKSADHALLFGNDADDMRTPGLGIDPRVMIDDMSSDPITYCTGRLQLVNQILPKLKDRFAPTGQSYQELRNSYFVLTSEIGTSLRVVSRQVGGVYIDRSFAGQPGAGKPFTPVSYQKQKDAMTFVNRYGFSPEAMKMPAEIYSMLQSQRRGFDHYGTNEDPKLHERMLNIHKDILSQLLHVNTVQRISDSELYGNTYKLSEFLTDLTDAIFKDDLEKSVSTARQNLQTEYINRLTTIQSSSSPYSNNAKAQAFSELNRVKRLTAKTVSPDAATKAHREYVTHLITRVMEGK